MSDIEIRLQELEAKLSGLEENMEKSSQLIEKLADLNNHMVDVICFITGIEPKDLIMSRDTRKDN